MASKFMLSCYKSGKIPQSVRKKLERYTFKKRCEIVSRTHKGSALFFIACEKGNVETMEYLLRECGANIEQRGRCEMLFETRYATPLGYASAAGNYDIVKFLVEHGADVNGRFDTGETLVWYACFWNYYEIVTYLVSHGANIQIPEKIGITCLMTSVKSVPLCKFLLSKGVDINARDELWNTALHYAIYNKRFETSKLLLENGSNPYTKDRFGNDPLQIACLYCQTDIFEYIIENYRYSRERIAEAYEFMGANILMKEYNVCLTKHFWSTAFNMMPKLFPHLHPTEFTTLEELNNMDLDQLHRQSKFIFTRILEKKLVDMPGEAHSEITYETRNERITRKMALNQYCSDLLKDGLELGIKKESLLHSEVCFVIQRLAKLFLCSFGEKKVADILLTTLMIPEALHFEHSLYSSGEKKFEEVLKLTTLIFNHLPEATSMIRTRPLHFDHLENFDKVFGAMLQLIYTLYRFDKTKEQVNQVNYITNQVLKSDFRDSKGNSLLHLVVSKSEFDDILSLPILICYPQTVFTEFLLQCEADVDCVNLNLNSPLNLASSPELIELLLNYGAHPDRKSDTGIPNIPNPFSYTTLQCLAARTILEKQVDFRGKVPALIEEFIKMH